MSEPMEMVATPWKESEVTCACCGGKSKTIWGDLSASDTTLAIYYVQWTVDSPEHMPNFDFVVGPWGDGTNPEDRILISLLFKPGPDGGSFMVIDSEKRLDRHRKICGRSMLRAEIVGTPLASEIFSFVDTIWLTDPRMSEVRDLNHAI
jgi:hypothetical protein